MQQSRTAGAGYQCGGAVEIREILAWFWAWGPLEVVGFLIIEYVHDLSHVIRRVLSVVRNITMLTQFEIQQMARRCPLDHVEVGEVRGTSAQ